MYLKVIYFNVYLILLCGLVHHRLQTQSAALSVLLDHLPDTSCQTPSSMSGRGCWLTIEPPFACAGGVLAAFGPPTSGYWVVRHGDIVGGGGGDGRRATR